MNVLVKMLHNHKKKLMEDNKMLALRQVLKEERIIKESIKDILMWTYQDADFHFRKMQIVGECKKILSFFNHEHTFESEESVFYNHSFDQLYGEPTAELTNHLFNLYSSDNEVTDTTKNIINMVSDRGFEFSDVQKEVIHLNCKKIADSLDIDEYDFGLMMTFVGAHNPYSKVARHYK